MPAGELVTAKTRIRRSTMKRLERLAVTNDRSVAAELRIAIARHLDGPDTTERTAA